MEDKEVKTAEQIAIEKQDAEYKEKYGATAKAEGFDKDGKPIKVYFRPTSRLVLGVALAELENNKLLACEYIFDDACIREISDYDVYRNDTGLFMGITPLLQTLVRVKKSTYTTL